MKKFISFLFVCVITLCALVGCGGGEKRAALAGYYQCVSATLNGVETTDEIGFIATIYDNRNFRIDSGWNDSLNTLYKVSGKTITFEKPLAINGISISNPIDGTVEGNRIVINFENGGVYTFEKVYGKYNFDYVLLDGENNEYSYEYFYIELSELDTFENDTREKLTIVYKKKSGSEVKEEYKFDITNGSSLRVIYMVASEVEQATYFTFVGDKIRIDFETPNGRIQAEFIKA